MSLPISALEPESGAELPMRILSAAWTGRTARASAAKSVERVMAGSSANGVEAIYRPRTLSGEGLQQAVVEFQALGEGLDPQALVPPVHAVLAQRHEEAGDAIDRNAGVAQPRAVGGALAHGREHRDPGPHVERHALDRLHGRRIHRR